MTFSSVSTRWTSSHARALWVASFCLAAALVACAPSDGPGPETGSSNGSGRGDEAAEAWDAAMPPTPGTTGSGSTTPTTGPVSPPAPAPSVFSPTPRCGGRAVDCGAYASTDTCNAAGCSWQQCSGSLDTNCWDITNAGNDLGLCQDLSPRCEVVNSFVGRVCQSGQSYSVPIYCEHLSGFSGADWRCRSQGCTWNEAGACNGEPGACTLRTADSCEEQLGCELVQQEETPCVASANFGCECPHDALDCEGLCINPLTSPLHCGACGNQCPRGFACVDGGCEDVDECTTGLCDAPHTCTNLEGTYTCQCAEGYDRLDEACVARDDCIAAGTPCGANASCLADATCVCDDGYQGDGFSCEDVDECTTGVCDAPNTCTNLTGSYACDCAEGYDQVGLSCVAQTDCIAAGTPCGANASCLEGATCACDDGYEGDGFSCDDVDECAEGALSCAQYERCENLDGSAHCVCEPGYARAEDGDCELVDPCVAYAACDTGSECLYDGSGSPYTCSCEDTGATLSCGSWVDMGWRSIQSTAPGMAGFWFRAPADLTITALRLPREQAGAYDPPRDPQVYVVRMQPQDFRDDLPSSDYEQLAWLTLPFNTTRVVSIDVNAGDFIGVLNYVRVDQYGSNTRTVQANWSNDQRTTYVANSLVSLYPLEGRLGYYLEEVSPVMPTNTGNEAAGYTEWHYQLR